MSFLHASLDYILASPTQMNRYNNYNLAADLRGDLELLKEELETMKTIANDLARYIEEDEDYAGDYMRQIRSLICQAEDAVDITAVKVQISTSWVSKAFNRLADYPKELRDAREMIRNSRPEVTEAFEQLQYRAVAKLLEDPPLMASQVEERHVVGFDMAIEVVSKLLTEGPEQLEIISIVGMLGLGKTALAKKVLNSPEVEYEYTTKAFACVGKEYMKRGVYLEILTCIMDISEEMRSWDEEQLLYHLRRRLEGNKYLVVLDDVWDVEDWYQLKHAFPKNRKRCRVLLTTRREKVANLKDIKFCYKLASLGPEESRELLCWRVFHQKHCPKVLEKYVEEIAERCYGLPLSIVVIAGVLVNLVDHTDRVFWWKHVANNVKDYILRNGEKTTKAMKLMYAKLPKHLKPCFLYLGVFPEQFEIPAWKLVRLWIAEELVTSEQNINLEDLAEMYLEELVCRNLVIVAQKKSDEKIKTCRLHSILHEFCKKEAMGAICKIKNDMLPSILFGNPAMDHCRFLCIDNANVLNYISSTTTGTRVRSFLTFHKEETIVEPNQFSSIPKTFKLLKVLESESFIFTRFPYDLRRLFLLRYIAISSNFSTLPSAMSVMLQLQTLIVNTSSSILYIEADIWKMPQFRHLHTNVSTHLPTPDTKCRTLVDTKIQTLSTIATESCRKEVLNQTPKLKKLSICGTVAKLFQFNSTSNQFGYLHSLELLEDLKLLNREGSNKLDRLPSEASLPQQLAKLTLSNTQLDWKEMSTIGKLVNLEVLKLKNNAFLGKLWQTENGGFLRLKNLHMGRTDLEIWRASAADFPQLKSLKLSDCNELQGVPQGLADILSLQSLVLHCTNPQVAASARSIEVLTQKRAENGNTSRFKLSVNPQEHLIAD